MIRTSVSNVTTISPDDLPPLHREGPVRLLVLSLDALGIATYGHHIETFAAEREDLDVVLVRIRPDFLSRLLTRRWAGGRRIVTYPRLMSARIRRWLRRHLPLEHFDAVFATREGTAMAPALLRRDHAFAYIVATDATAPAYQAAFGQGSSQGGNVSPDERTIYGNADLIAPYSQWTAASLRQHYAIPDERIMVTRPAMRLPDRAQLQRGETSRDRQPKLIFIGNQWVRKGGPQLLRWHQQYWANRAELHVCSSRATPDRNARNVIWHGSVDHATLFYELLPTMDLFVLPTREDTYGHVFVEAMAWGVPAVGGDVGAVDELIHSGHTGFVCEPHDERGFVQAIDRLIDDVELRRQMGAAARARAEAAFDGEKNYQALFDRIVALADVISGHR